MSYTYNEVLEALNNHTWLLSTGLDKVKHYAHSQGFTELEKWAIKEVEGYPKATAKSFLVNHRSLFVGGTNSFGAEVSDVKVYVLSGVSAFEAYAKAGIKGNNLFDWKFDRAIDRNELANPNISSASVQSLLNNIRRQAIERLLQEQPRVPPVSLVFPAPNFGDFVADAKISSILSRRWSEANICFQAKAYLSTLVLLGSILEGALLDKILNNRAEASRAAAAPKERGTNNVLSPERWMLDNMINVAHQCNWIKQNTKDFSQSVRDYRNYIHPQKELSDSPTFDAGTCELVFAVVKIALTP